MSEKPKMFARTLTELDAGELYPCCPRCNGRQDVSVCTKVSNGFSASQWECISCPLCHGTGEADADAARDYIETIELEATE